MRLEDQIETLGYDIAFWMCGITDPAYSMDSLGDLSIEVSEKLRSLAIIQLVTKVQIDFFLHNLIRSAMVREIYLRRCRDEGRLDEHHRASGRYGALLDAVAAGDLERAARIAELSPIDWRKGREYEDDYCYAQILHRFVQSPARDDEVQAFLDQFSAYLEGRDDARFAVSQALLRRDQKDFDQAFNELLAQRDAEIAANKKRGELEEPQALAQRIIFVEGLAILRLAELRGLSAQREYPLCPAIARMPMTKPFPGE